MSCSELTEAGGEGVTAGWRGEVKIRVMAASLRGLTRFFFPQNLRLNFGGLEASANSVILYPGKSPEPPNRTAMRRLTCLVALFSLSNIPELFLTLRLEADSLFHVQLSLSPSRFVARPQEARLSRTFHSVTSIMSECSRKLPRQIAVLCNHYKVPSGRFEAAAANVAAGERREMPDARQSRPFLLGDSATL